LPGDKTPLTDSADLIVGEYPWQRPMAAARSDFRRAIAVAEQKLSTFLNYDVATRYRSEGYAVGYLKHLPQSGAYGNWGGYYPGGYNYRFGGALLQLNVGKLQRIATVSYSNLVASTVLNYTDGDNDGLNDTFTAEFPDTTSDPASVLIAFSASRPAGQQWGGREQQPGGLAGPARHGDPQRCQHLEGRRAVLAAR
jgi:hypothetical protein